jgi:sugar/nucleoside kinase (ribokinase family)
VKTYLREFRPATQKVVLCPNDRSVIVDNRQAILDLLDLADYVIVNETEAEELFGMSDHDIAAQMRERGKVGAITNGIYGATIFDATETLEVDAAEPPRARENNNGAGDAFAAGYLAGIIWGYDLRSAGEIGRFCAGEILTVVGARPDEYQARAVLDLIEQRRRPMRLTCPSPAGDSEKS